MYVSYTIYIFIENVRICQINVDIHEIAQNIQPQRNWGEIK